MDNLLGNITGLKQYFLNKQQLPLVIEPEEGQADSSNLKQILLNNNPQFKQSLLQYGGILFRGFKIDSLDKFAEVMASCSLGEAYKYELCPVKRVYLRDGITASLNLDIPLHNEKSYAKDYPTHIYFNCLQAADRGGETPLANGRKIWLSLPEHLRNKLKSKGILHYRHYYGDGPLHTVLKRISGYNTNMSWYEHFETTDRQVVERILKERGERFKWGWGSRLTTEITLPACRENPNKKELVWFNNSNFLNQHDNINSNFIKSKVDNPLFRFMLLNKYVHPYMAYFGDGEPFSKEESLFIKEAITQNTILFTWKDGDVLILDNYACLHGKNPHEGDRQVLVGLTKNYQLKTNE